MPKGKGYKGAKIRTGGGRDNGMNQSSAVKKPTLSKRMGVTERGAAGIHRGQALLDSTIGPLGNNAEISKKTPTLDSIMAGRKRPYPPQDTTSGADIARKGKR